MKLSKIKDFLDRFHYWILGCIFALAVLLRIIGIGWGLPFANLHPDEGIIYGKAFQCALERNFEVEDYYYRPNHVLIKLNTLLYIGIQDLYFAPQGQDDFNANFNENVSLFITASRVIIALFGIGIVIMAYFIALMWGKRQALFSSMLFAIFPAFVEHSHYITPDIPLLFFLMCVIYMALLYIRKPSTHLLFGMALLTAFGTCEKYPGAFGCLIIAVAVCITYYKKPAIILREGIKAIAFFVVSIMAVSPVLIVDYKDVLTEIAGQNAEYHLGGDGLNFWETVWFYLKTTGNHVGMILTLFSIFGLYKSFKKNWKDTVVLVLFLVYLLPISMLKVHWERYTLPIYAVVLMFGAFGILYFMDSIGGKIEKNSLLGITAVCILVLLPFGSLFLNSIAVCGSFLAPDSRIYLQDTFASMGINENNTAHDCNTPLDPGGYYGAFSNFENADPNQFKYGEVSYVMTSSSQRDQFFASKQEIYGGVAEFYRKLDAEHELIYLFPVENPSFHFVELQNIWYAARSIHRYLNGACTGFEIRLYMLNK